LLSDTVTTTEAGNPAIATFEVSPAFWLSPLQNFIKLILQPVSINPQSQKLPSHEHSVEQHLLFEIVCYSAACADLELFRCLWILEGLAFLVPPCNHGFVYPELIGNLGCCTP
jgi:hypothetical protein